MQLPEAERPSEKLASEIRADVIAAEIKRKTEEASGLGRGSATLPGSRRKLSVRLSHHSCRAGPWKVPEREWAGYHIQRKPAILHPKFTSLFWSVTLKAQRELAEAMGHSFSSKGTRWIVV